MPPGAALLIHNNRDRITRPFWRAKRRDAAARRGHARSRAPTIGMPSTIRTRGSIQAGSTGPKRLRPAMTTVLERSNPRRSRLRQRLSGWLSGPTLARDIAIVLAIKIAFLMVLKFAFFNHPQADHMVMPPDEVAQALLSPRPVNQSQGDPHARQ